jgi:hypothetical protein
MCIGPTTLWPGVLRLCATRESAVSIQRGRGVFTLYPHYEEMGVTS